MRASKENLSTDVLNGLLDFSGYFHRIGLTKDYKLMLDLYGKLFPELKAMTQIGIDVVDLPQLEIQRDWGKAAHKLWAKLEQIEPDTLESEKMNDYFRVLEIFVLPFQYLAPILAEKVSAYHDAKRKRLHGTASNFRRIQTDPDVKIERCAECPGGKQQPAELPAMRTFSARKENEVKTKEQIVQEAREKILNGEDI